MHFAMWGGMKIGLKTDPDVIELIGELKIAGREKTYGEMWQKDLKTQRAETTDQRREDSRRDKE